MIIKEVFKRILWLGTFSMTSLAWAQIEYQQRFDIPVIGADGKELIMPWTGGLNSPQINTIDLNNDGKHDLVLFDRMADKFFTFLKTPTGHIYEPKYEREFPAGLTNWVLLRDFNGDGRKDIFTSHPFGMQVFVNIGVNPLTWRQYNAGSALFTQGFNQPHNLKINTTDIPVIEDLDGDGDLDILNMEFASSSTIEFHQNMSVELTGSSDSLQMKLITQRWGDLTFCGCNSFVFGNINCPAGGRLQHTGGKALLVANVERNTVFDLFFSDESCNVVHYLHNAGTNQSPVFQSASPWGNIDSHIFPAVYYEDIDVDGAKDIVISGNASHREEAEADFSTSIKLFKNTQGSFIEAEKYLLQSDMIDVSDASVPAFFDEDGDGDLDLFIGYYAKTFDDGHDDHGQYSGSIAYYRNTGSFKSPQFTWVSNDYSNLSAHNFVNLKPQFSDLNQDGMRDLVFTANEQTTGKTKLFYLLNKSVTELHLNASIKTVEFDFTGEENICFTDFDRDGDPDILCGRYDGSIQLWLNNGQLQFKQTNTLDYLDKGTLRIAPFLSVSDLNADGKDDLLMGDQTGLVKIVLDYKSGLNLPLDIKLQRFDDEESYEIRKLNNRVYPASGNLFFSNKPQLVVGMQTGGLLLFNPVDNEQLKIDELFEIYPNPVVQLNPLTIKTKREGAIQVFNVLGQAVGQPIIIPQGESQFVPNLPRGVYFIRLYLLGDVTIKRLIVE